ncbi:T7SS effector LXG polymorphic toxin [Weissella muntiaci]|nr:T7SS effector LXG polymorphic toxin [Weissella muntiaci]
MKEVFENLRRLQSSAQKQADAADKASHGFQNIVSTNAFQGATGEAVKNNAANVHVPVQKAIKDMDKLLVQEYEQTISDFQSSVKETDANAILDENILQDLSRDLEKLIDENNQISKKFAQIYHSVDDIVALKNPSTTNFTSAVRESKKVLADTIQSVYQFEAGGKASSVDELASATKSQLNRAKSVGGMAYSDVRLQDAFKDNTFTKAVDKVDKQISLAEKAARQKAIKEQKKRQADWGKKHPVASWLEEKAAGIGNWWERNVTKGGSGISAKHLFKDIIKSGRQFMDGGLNLTGQSVSANALGTKKLSKVKPLKAKKSVSKADIQKLNDSQLNVFIANDQRLKDTLGNSNSDLSRNLKNIIALENGLKKAPDKKKQAQQRELNKQALETFGNNVAENSGIHFRDDKFGYYFDSQVAIAHIGDGMAGAFSVWDMSSGEKTNGKIPAGAYTNVGQGTDGGASKPQNGSSISDPSDNGLKPDFNPNSNLYGNGAVGNE